MQNNIESHLIEKRVLKPGRDFVKKARIGSLEDYRRRYRESIKAPEKFWARGFSRRRSSRSRRGTSRGMRTSPTTFTFKGR